MLEFGFQLDPLFCVCVCARARACLYICTHSCIGDNNVYSIMTGAISNLDRTSRNVISARVGVCLSGKEGQGCPSRRVSAFEPSSPNDAGKLAQQILTQTKVVCGFCYEPHNLAVWIPVCRLAAVHRMPYTVP